MPFLIPILLFAAATQPYDVVIRNGHVIDGTGSPWYAADIGIRDGRIAAIGHLEGAPARRTLDARGMVVAPGFIDMLGQSEMSILVDPHLPSKIYQGITTEITGEGGSIAPLNDAIIQCRPRHLGALRPAPRLAHLPRVLRPPAQAGDGDQPGELRGRHRGAPHGAGRRQPRPHRRRARAYEGAGARRHAGRRHRAFHLAAIRPGALCQDRRADRAGVGSGQGRRHLRLAHPR